MLRNQDLADSVLLMVAEAHERVRSSRPPPKYKTFEYQCYEDDVRLGPHFSAPGWFGQMALGDSARISCLRKVYELARDGLVEIIPHAQTGRPQRVVLTDRGREVVASLRSRESVAQAVKGS
jgi:hypothetical protein